MAESAGLWRVLDDLPVAAALVDLDGTILHVNEAAVRRYGWPSGEAPVGLPSAVLAHGLPERLASGSWRGELPATSSDGGTFLGAFDVSPLHDEAGTVIGSIVVCLDATRRAEAEPALDRSRRDEVERSGRRRQELLARATGVLAGSLVPEAMATTIGRLAVQELADAWSVHIHDGTALRTAAAVHRDPQLEQQMVELAGDARGEALTRYLDQLVARGRSLLVQEIHPGDWERWLGDPALAAKVARFDAASAIVVGLHSGGKRLGVLSATRRTGRPPFDQDDFVLVAALAGRLAAALDGALAHRARAEVARTLQASLLPPRLPEIAGIALAARYDPVGDGSLVGGDFYDAFPIGTDRWGLVLGDVCGQGVPAAALTSLVRYTVRAAARIWQSPAEILRFTNGAILDDDTGERFCTLLVCVLRPRPDGATLTLAAAGHHLPLLHVKGATPEPVGTTGAALEARDPDGVMVDERFLEDLLVDHAGEGADLLAEAVERAVLAVSGGRARDDVAVVVAEVMGIDDLERGVGPSFLEPGPFSQRYRAELVEVPVARWAVAGWLTGQDVRPSMVPDLLLVVTELVTNAIRAARSMVDVRCWLTSDAVMVEVTDDGPGFDPGTQRTTREPDPLAERGRGLFLVAALVDECTIESGPNGTIVRCFSGR